MYQSERKSSSLRTTSWRTGEKRRAAELVGAGVLGGRGGSEQGEGQHADDLMMLRKADLTLEVMGCAYEFSAKGGVVSSLGEER